MDAPFSLTLKRHHPHAPPPPPSPSPAIHPKSPAGETIFRILCPASKAGGVIGKGGAVIRQLREETGARIRVVDEGIPTHCDERVILIVSHSNTDSANPNLEEEVSTAAQSALVKVFERILKVDEERGVDDRRESGGGSGSGSEGTGLGLGFVVCRVLAPSSQVGSVLGRGGKIVEKIRQESGARVRVLPRENLPGCATPGDELIQITGNVQAVKKALLSVSSCLQEHPRADTLQGANISGPMDSVPQRGMHTVDHHSRGFMSPPASEHRMVPEEDIVFKLLCPAEKIGCLIGKGGSIVRVIENETGASIKIGDVVAHDSDERVVVISTRENLDLQRSPAQDAVIRVHSRVAEVTFEPGAPVVARLLVHSQQIGCLLGKGGLIVAEMRRLTGANIRIFGREQGLKFSTPNDEVVQVIGNLQSVQDALFQITGRLREIIFPRPYFSHATYPELPSPSFRPRHDQASPSHYHSPVGFSHSHGYSYDNRPYGQGQGPPPAFSHGFDRSGGVNSEQDRHRYSGDRASYGPSFERPPSPGAWHTQAVNSGYADRFLDKGPTCTGMVLSSNETSQIPVMKSVEVVVPQIFLPHVYGENKTNLGHVKQFSGADVIVHDPKPGATEGLVVISGTPNQLHAAQGLVHAFILCGQAF